MAIQEVTINDFHAGVLSDETVHQSGNPVVAGLDIVTKDGYIGALPRSVAMSEAAAPNDIDEKIWWITRFDGDMWALQGGTASGGKLFKNIAGTWTRQHTNTKPTTGGGGLIEFGGNLYYVANQYLGKATTAPAYTDGFKTFSTSTPSVRPTAIFAGQLCIGNNNRLAVLDADGSTWTPSKLTLDSDLVISSLVVWNNKLWIGTHNKKYILGHAQWGSVPASKLFSWDGATDTPEDAFDINIGGISAMAEFKNRLIIWGGARGEMYEFNGASLDKLPSPDTGVTQVNAYGYPYPGAVAAIGNILYFGLSSMTQTDNKPIGGVWGLVQKDITKPVALMQMYNSTGGRASDKITAIQLADSKTGSLFFAHFSATPSYGIDQTSTNLSIVAYLETPRFEFPVDVQIVGIRLNAEYPADTTTKVTISYETDDAGFTSVGDITRANYQDILYFDSVNCRNLKLKIEWTPNATINFWLAGYTIYYQPRGRFYTR